MKVAPRPVSTHEVRNPTLEREPSTRESMNALIVTPVRRET